MKIGDKFLVLQDRHKGLILTIKEIEKRYSSLSGNVKYFYPKEDVQDVFSEDVIRKWSQQDEDIRKRFHKLFEFIEDNKQHVRHLIEKFSNDSFYHIILEYHHDNLIVIKEKYNIFLFENKFSKESIRKINSIYEIEIECKNIYKNDPNLTLIPRESSFIYAILGTKIDSNAVFQPKYSIEEINKNWRLFVAEDFVDIDKNEREENKKEWEKLMRGEFPVTFTGKMNY